MTENHKLHDNVVFMKLLMIATPTILGCIALLILFSLIDFWNLHFSMKVVVVSFVVFLPGYIFFNSRKILKAIKKGGEIE